MRLEKVCKSSKASSSVASAVYQEMPSENNKEKDLPHLPEHAAIRARLHEATLRIEHLADGTTFAGQLAENYELEAVTAHEGYPFTGLSLARHDGQWSLENVP